MYAFERAVAEGYRHLETDVHTTADGRLVAFHDDDLERVVGVTGRIEEHPWSELTRLRVAGVDPIPLLSDLLDRFPQARFNIDIKTDSAAAPLADLLSRPDLAERVCVASFSSRRLRRFRRLAPQVTTAATPDEVAWFGFAPLLRRRPPGPGSVLQVPARILHDRVALVRHDVIAAAHAAGRSVQVWTVDDGPEIERLIDLGVDGIVSNDLRLLKSVLQRRGLWQEAA